MRLTRAFSLLAVLLVGASASSLTSRAPANPLDSRDLVDVCAFIDVGLTVDLLGIVITVGLLEICLCISAIPTFITTNAVAKSAVALAGTSQVTQTLTSLINEHAPDGHCVFPPYAIPECIGNNPCGFSCGDGFVPSPPSKPTECICPAPFKVCNGICTPVSVCPSSKPYKRDKRWAGSGTCNARGVGHMACGVFGGGARAWECVDTDNDLESCGGCILPLTPYTPTGIDCTAIPGVADVSCQSGACTVRRCLPGYTTSADASHCLRNNSDEDVEDVSASQYGLEHVPLKA